MVQDQHKERDSFNKSFRSLICFYIGNNDIRHDTKNYNSSHEKTSRSSIMLEERYVVSDFIFIFENVRFIFIQICIALLDEFFYTKNNTR